MNEPGNLCLSLISIGECLRLDGEIVESRAWYTRALEVADLRGELSIRASGFAALALAELDLGSSTEAERWCELLSEVTRDLPAAAPLYALSQRIRILLAHAEDWMQPMEAPLAFLEHCEPHGPIDDEIRQRLLVAARDLYGRESRRDYGRRILEVLTARGALRQAQGSRR